MDDGFHTFDPAAPPPMLSGRCAALLKYWNRLRGDRAFPTRAEIDPGQLIEILPHLMIVGIEYQPFRALYRLVGTEIVRFAKFDFTGRYADALKFEDDAEDDWTRFYRAVVAARLPGVGVSHWTMAGGLRRWIEFVICPLSSDGEIIDRCLSIEDYDHLNVIEIDALPPVAEH